MGQVGERIRGMRWVKASSKAEFNLSLLIINSRSRIACGDLDLPLFSGCPSASHLKYLTFAGPRVCA